MTATCYLSHYGAKICKNKDYGGKKIENTEKYRRKLIVKMKEGYL